MKLFGPHDEENIKEGPDFARVLMNNHNNQIALQRLQENLSNHDLTLIEYDSVV